MGSDLKTTPEERAALRDIADDTSAWSIGRGTKANMGDAMDDIDTLLAEVERLREGLGHIRRLDASFSPTVARACQTMAAINAVLTDLETK